MFNQIDELSLPGAGLRHLDFQSEVPSFFLVHVDDVHSSNSGGEGTALYRASSRLDSCSGDREDFSMYVIDMYQKKKKKKKSDMLTKI
jgi:hypothetical protein